MQSDRLTLRPWTIDDADRLFDIRRRPDVAKWLGDPVPWVDLDQTIRTIGEWRAICDADDALGAWAIEVRETGLLVGTVNLSHLPDSDEVHIGWSLHPDSFGNGYATEAAKLVLAMGAAAGHPRIWAVMWPNNDASARVALAAGMTDLGVVDDRWYGTDEEPTSRMFRHDRPEP